MAFKPIDVQVSLPRTVEMTPLHHQQQQRASTEQTLLGQQASKHAEQEAKRSAKTEETSGQTVSEREPRKRDEGKHSPDKRRSDEEAAKEQAGTVHPFKGKHIDFSG